MKITNIGVIGAGTMGHGIALVAAKAGYNVSPDNTVVEEIDGERYEDAATALDKLVEHFHEISRLHINKKGELESNIKI